MVNKLYMFYGTVLLISFLPTPPWQPPYLDQFIWKNHEINDKCLQVLTKANVLCGEEILNTNIRCDVSLDNPYPWSSVETPLVTLFPFWSLGDSGALLPTLNNSTVLRGHVHDHAPSCRLLTWPMPKEQTWRFQVTSAKKDLQLEQCWKEWLGVEDPGYGTNYLKPKYDKTLYTF